MPQKTIVHVDTRNYNRKQFVQDLLAHICGAHLDKTTASQAVTYINQNAKIVDFDGNILSAARWRDDIAAEIKASK